MNPDRSASSPGALLASSRLASGTTTPSRMVRGRLISRGLRLGWPVDEASTGSPMVSPSALRRCRQVPSNSPVSGSMSSTSNQPPLTASADTSFVETSRRSPSSADTPLALETSRSSPSSPWSLSSASSSSS
jgi:hypothetical protein